MKIFRRSASIRSFTLIEIMITLVIVGILATIAIPSYQNFIEDGKSRLCATNLEALKSAFDIYMVEHNVVPGDLGQLSPETIDKALAQAIRAKGWSVQFALFIERQQARGYAFANSLVEELGKGNLNMLVCPSDSRQRSTGTLDRVVSYGINQDIVSVTKDEYVQFSNDTVIFADSNEQTFPGIPQSSGKRHKHLKGISSAFHYANAVTKGSRIKQIGGGYPERSAYSSVGNSNSNVGNSNSNSNSNSNVVYSNVNSNVNSNAVYSNVNSNVVNSNKNVVTSNVGNSQISFTSTNINNGAFSSTNVNIVNGNGTITSNVNGNVTNTSISNATATHVSINNGNVNIGGF